MELLQQKKGSPVSGFYYDNQIVNNLLCASLHPNSRLKTIKDGSGKDKADWFPVDDPEEGDLDGSGDRPAGKSVWPYSKTPLCSCLIPEDFQVAIANTWSEFGSDPIGELWNSVKPYAPYVDKLKDPVYGMVNKAIDYAEGPDASDGSFFSRAMKTISEIGKSFIGKDIMGKSAKLLTRSLIMKTSRFTYYQGTGIDFGGNLGMKFTLFYGWGQDPKSKYTDSPKYKFVTVEEQLSQLLPYVVGEFKPVDVGEFTGDDPPEKKNTNRDMSDSEQPKTIMQDYSEGVKNFLQEYGSWQFPPSGYMADINDIDNCFKGTLKLHIGDYYAIENLVVQNIQLNFSKIMAKRPDKTEADSDLFTPLYCDVNMVLKPASRYSRNSLERFVYGRASKSKRKSTSFEIANSLDLQKGDYYV